MSVLDRIVAAVTPPESEEDRAKAREKARAAAAPGDWLDQILQHHEQIEAAFGEARAATDAQSRTLAQRRLGALLTGHSNAEEAVIYPQLSNDHKTHMAMAYEEQQAAKVQMALLEALDPLSHDWLEKLEHIRGAVAHHVYEEENDRFVHLKEELPPADQDRMTARYREEMSRYDAQI
ncbi:hemerythrin domain-containing protein [Sphingobium bisphenolivorans]|uniref:hemerythrin domain-containing protein n=1 Tax=Sphingobium bisphenolivorans TaxID=1335760 RepID=UPI0003A039B1|nr:hemerythrin domain-containing protein [Sphingobium bisphenolivorans]